MAAARNLSVLSDVLCGDVSHTAVCFYYYGLPQLLTSVGNTILVPGVVERLCEVGGRYYKEGKLQLSYPSTGLTGLVVPWGLCSSICVKGSFGFSISTTTNISTLLLESQGSPRPSQKKGQRQGWSSRSVIQSNYLIQFWWLDVKRNE